MSGTMVRYVVTGISAYMLELTVLVTLVGTGISPILSVGISFWIGLISAFLLQKIFAFKNKDRGARRLIWQAVSYGILVLFNYLFTLAFVALTLPIIGVLIARTIALGITTTWNYIVYRLIIFNPNFAAQTLHTLKNIMRNSK